MIIATIRMMIPPQKRGEASRILKSVAELCKDDPGCLSCNIYRDLNNNRVLVLEEVWRTEEDLDLHLRSEEYRNLLLVLEMALELPEIRFDTISSPLELKPSKRREAAERKQLTALATKEKCNE